ncbi:MAG: hypothetical protein U1B84_13465, partial [Variovorax sp.]|nr:hypothetical protein [Variovorax sp.]
MAHTYITKLGGSAFNLDWAVGATGTNGQADVMLIQSLFNILYFDHEGNPGEGRSQRYFPPGDTAALVVDGRYGPLTQRYIELPGHAARGQHPVPHQPAPGARA